MRSRPSNEESVYDSLLIDSKAIWRDDTFMLVSVELHNTVTSSGGYKYTFGAGTHLQVLTSESCRQDKSYWEWCLFILTGATANDYS